MQDRPTIKQNYSATSSRIATLLGDLAKILYDQDRSAAENILSELKSLFALERNVRGELLALKETELSAAPEPDRQYLARLTKSFSTLDTLLGALFYHANSPFTYQWPEVEQWAVWENNISGFKETIPLASKKFVDQLADYYAMLERMVDYN
ncbi:hypothetical protein FWH30_01405 [Microgenomates group bacterium]|nr:hypothetical protein [Microgenomates group bacterium]